MRASFFIVGFFTILFLNASLAQASVPVFLPVPTQRDVITIDNPSHAQKIYGTLDNFPHTYQIVSGAPFFLSFQILQPDRETSSKNISAIIIKEPTTKGRVIEIARLHAHEVSWGKEYVYGDGWSYLTGPVFERALEPGVYRIQLYTPENIAQYVLRIGTESGEGISYFTRIHRLFQMAEFFEASPFGVLRSGYVHIPLAIIVGVFAFFFVRARKRRSVY